MGIERIEGKKQKTWGNAYEWQVVGIPIFFPFPLLLVFILKIFIAFITFVKMHSID